MTRSSLKVLVGPFVIGLVALVLWVSIGVGISDWRNGQLDRLAALKNNQINMLQRVEGLRSDITSFSDHDITDLFWTASQPGEATAFIQSTTSGTASKNGILLRSVTPFTPREQTIEGAFGFRLEFEAHLDQVTEFLKDIEYDRPAIVIDRIVLRRLNRPGDTGDQPTVFAQVELLAPVILTGDGE